MKSEKKLHALTDRPATSRWRMATFGAVALGAALVLLSLQRSLEYDEAWTLLHYTDLSVAAIFGDLVTPNNHPLNTLLMKMAGFASTNGNVWLNRLPALLAWAMMLALGIAFLHRKLHNDLAEFCGVATLTLNGMLLHYAGTARGYSLQSFCIFLAWIAMLELVKFDRDKRAFWGLVIGALGALFSITSGALLVAALALAGGCAYLLPVANWRNFFRAHCRLWIAGAIFAVAALAWFLPHWAALQEARKFGIPLHGVWEYCTWAWGVLWNLRLVPWCAAAIAVLLFGRGAGRRDAVMALAFPLFCFLLSLLTNAGPERVYTAMIPVVIASTTCALADCPVSKWRMVVLLAATLLSVLPVNRDLARLEGPDWRTVALKATQLPDGVLPIYRSADSFPVRFNTPEAVNDWQRRLARGRFSALVALNPPLDQLEASGKAGAPVAFTPGVLGVCGENLHRATTVQFGVRALTRENEVAGRTLLLCASNVTGAQIAAFWNLPEMAPERENWLECNLFLNERSNGANALVSRLWILPSAERTADDYCGISDAFPSFAFFEITELKQ